MTDSAQHDLVVASSIYTVKTPPSSVSYLYRVVLAQFGIVPSRTALNKSVGVLDPDEKFSVHVYLGDLMLRLSIIIVSRSWI